MKRDWILAAAISAALGALWHFLYDWFPCALTALLCPVNESVWEHLKLLYFPPLACAVFLSLRVPGPQRRFWSGILAGVLLSVALLTGSFYTLTAGFGLPSAPTLDIPLYYICLAALWTIARALNRSGAVCRALGLLVIACGAFGTALVVFSIAAPPLPIFQA